MYKNPFLILGINANSSKDDIKKAYKEIALCCHPDKLINVIDDSLPTLLTTPKYFKQVVVEFALMYDV